MGVGVALGVLIVIAGIVGAFLRNRGKRNTRVNGEQTANPYTENLLTAMVTPEYRAEMDGTT
jgi:hypothetical protein